MASNWNAAPVPNPPYVSPYPAHDQWAALLCSKPTALRYPTAPPGGCHPRQQPRNSPMTTLRRRDGFGLATALTPAPVRSDISTTGMSASSAALAEEKASGQSFPISAPGPGPQSSWTPRGKNATVTARTARKRIGVCVADGSKGLHPRSLWRGAITCRAQGPVQPSRCHRSRGATTRSMMPEGSQQLSSWSRTAMTLIGRRKLPAT